MNVLDLISGLVLLVPKIEEGQDEDQRRRTPLIVCHHCHEAIMEPQHGVVLVPRMVLDGEEIASPSAHVQRPLFVHDRCREPFCADSQYHWRVTGTLQELLETLAETFRKMQEIQASPAEAAPAEPYEPPKKRTGRPGFAA